MDTCINGRVVSFRLCFEQLASQAPCYQERFRCLYSQFLCIWACWNCAASDPLHPFLLRIIYHEVHVRWSYWSFSEFYRTCNNRKSLFLWPDRPSYSIGEYQHDHLCSSASVCHGPIPSPSRDSRNGGR